MAIISQPSTAVTTLIKVHLLLTILFFLLPSAIMDTKQQIRLSLMQPTKELLLLQFWVRMPLTTGAAAHAALICHGRSCFLSQPLPHTVLDCFQSYGAPPTHHALACAYPSTTYYHGFIGTVALLSQLLIWHLPPSSQPWDITFTGITPCQLLTTFRTA